ncbi:hypothetical protein NDU88_000811 [Pleurodeles waltl]|uniref:Uncharacterized protein n=1 Tax=Pleurodeles waltl TaxID=8319 RepID=A0AAV7TIC3_PLEWA|nr:hypothetical protein NDU88_000811 [Pleurodeles waltl]
MVETVRGGLSRRPAPAVFCPGPALREGPAEPFLPRVQSWKRRPRGGGAEAESRPGSGRSGQGLFGGRLWAACRPSRRTPSPRSGLGEYASAGTQQARVRKPPTGAPGWGSCDRAAGESSGWAWVEGPLQTTNTQPHTVSLPLCHDARGAGSRRPRRSSPDVPGSEALNRAPVGPPRVGPSHPPACPAPMGPGPVVRRARGGLPGRPGGQGPRGGPCPDGPRPGCPADPGRPPRPSRGVRGLRVGPCPDGPRPGGQGPRPGCPADPGRPPRPSRGSGAPGRTLPRWAPARVSGEASRGGGGQGPGSGPAPMGPLPGVRGRLPGPSRGSGAPGRALPRRAPSRVSGEASQAVPGVRGPGSGGPSPPILQAPARVSG